jgi:hypothetical protein
MHRPPLLHSGSPSPFTNDMQIKMAPRVHWIAILILIRTLSCHVFLPSFSSHALAPYSGGALCFFRHCPLHRPSVRCLPSRCSASAAGTPCYIPIASAVMDRLAHRSMGSVPWPQTRCTERQCFLLRQWLIPVVYTPCAPCPRSPPLSRHLSHEFAIESLCLKKKKKKKKACHVPCCTLR